MESIELFCKTLLLWFCWNLLGCHNDRAGPARESSSAKLHIRINWTPAHGPLQWLPPTQMKGILGCQSKTPVAQNAVCLGAPTVPGKSQHRWSIDDHPSKFRKNQNFNS